MRRVAVTGFGTINALGLNVDETFKNAINGVNGIDYIKGFDTSRIKVNIAGELKNFNLEDHFDRSEIRRNDRVILYGLLAADEAFKQSKIMDTNFDPYRFGVYFTSGIGGLDTLESEISVRATKGPNRMSPFFIPKARSEERRVGKECSTLR